MERIIKDQKIAKILLTTIAWHQVEGTQQPIEECPSQCIE